MQPSPVHDHPTTTKPLPTSYRALLVDHHCSLARATTPRHADHPHSVQARQVLTGTFANVAPDSDHVVVKWASPQAVPFCKVHNKR
eukprot:1482856-Rhodomonas_salina.1